MKQYANNTTLNQRILDAVSSVESGSPTEGLTAMIKNVPTEILKASNNHEERRYKPGNKLITYNGIDTEGKPIQETWGGGVADITENSVILRNVKPINYPKEHELTGQEVRGFYDETGIFHVDQEKGNTVLYNEYVSDAGFVKGAYGVTATETWQQAFKLDKSYVFEVPAGVEGVDVNDLHREGTGAAKVSAGDYIVIDIKKAKVISVHGCEREQLKKTFIDLEEHLKTL